MANWIWKEIRVALFCGVTLAVANFLKLIIIDKVTLVVNIIVNVTLIFTICIAKLLGCTLPLLAKKAKLDPAVMINPFITTLVDACSLIIYFKIATQLLGL